MTPGYLRISTIYQQSEEPFNKGATVIIYRARSYSVLYRTKTDNEGLTDYMSLEAPDVSTTLDPNQTEPAYSLYDVEVSCPGFDTVHVYGAEILGESYSTLPIEMLPADTITRGQRMVHRYLQPYGYIDVDGPEDTIDEGHPESDIEITEHGLVMDSHDPAEPFIDTRGIRDVYIPTNITVHLGAPSNSSARNVTVPFPEYIANVASSEIYSTWPRQALYANMYAITTFAINRIYTEWYRGRGYNFDITNNTAYDQYFVYGRNIYNNLQEIANEIFDMYVRRQGFKNPLFTQYCSGTTVTCDGLSQWGTVSLANQGMSALQILRYYYGNDIEIVESGDVRAIQETYPGNSMRQGQNSEYIKLMQQYLNRIRLNYPAINEIANPNGYFGTDTTSAVRTFQKAFGITQDGVIGRATWNKISQIYVSIIKLAELKSEGERIGIGTAPPSVTLRQGSSGNNVRLLQYILDYISEFVDFVPSVTEDGRFGSGTANAVKEFQRNYGLTADGIVGAGTWQRLYEVWNSLNSTIDVPMPPANQVLPEYPGTVLTTGSTGVQVGYIQKSINSIHEQYPKIPAVTVDNNYGPATAAAVRAFQEQFELAADGVTGRNTWEKINSVLLATGDVNQNTRPAYPGTSYRSGSRGTDVIYIQKSLQTLSQYLSGIPNPGTADGVFGARTDASVRAFQRYVGLTADGVVGPATWNAINTQLNKIPA
jgi:peptidoglycan hydrolase-like protein with peptidoglycan-binding domain